MTDTRPRILAAIDIGSNSIKLTVARRVGDDLEEVHSESETVRLGEGIETSGRLSDARMAAGRGTLARFAAAARALGAERVLAVATEALRVAANGQEFLDRVVHETSIEAELIDGDREAALTFAGLAATMELAGALVVADIGGASTEVIVADDGVVRAASSLPVGSGRLTDRFVASDPPSASDLERCRAEMRALVAAEAGLVGLPTGTDVRLTLLGGTGEYLGRLVAAAHGVIMGEVERVLKRLTQVPAASLAVELAVAEARARVLPAGVAIAAAMADVVQPGAIEVARSGIRTGLLLEAFGLLGMDQEEEDGVR